MNEVLTAGLTGVTAFTITNLDDVFLLTVFFSQVNATFRRRHIVLGQYLGFCVLLLVSLPGFLGATLVPRRWIGLLGLVPIALGLGKLVNPQEDLPEDLQEPVLSRMSPWDSFLSPHTYSVAAITVANGSDNLGIYVPLFSTCSLVRLLVIVGVFLVLIGVWCYGTSKLVRQQAIAQLLAQRGSQFLPFILIGIGAFIVLESSALHPFALVVSGLCLTGLVKKSFPVTDLQVQPIANAEPPDIQSPPS